MAIKTDIEYCDSTLNLMMGCDGCELWNLKAGVRYCYAGELTARYGGRKGWPNTFEEPALFTDRLDAALKWSDLTGTDRPDRPWLNGMPRVIFMNDMGDTFTESLPIDWLAPLLPTIAESPHQFMILTKRAKRMREFCELHRLPDNIWPGVSVTSQATAQRVTDLVAIRSGGPKWISAEPLLGPIDFREVRTHSGFKDVLIVGDEGGHEYVGSPRRMIQLCVAGGESGTHARPMHPDWARSIRDQCEAAGVAFFFKQWGAWQNGSSNRHNAAVLNNGKFVFPDTIEGRKRLDRELGFRWDAFNPVSMSKVGKEAAGRLLDGREWNEMPEVIHATTN